ncbi:hypothetical protein Ancab_003421 [Ancistrocladus abbreviatus]
MPSPLDRTFSIAWRLDLACTSQPTTWTWLPILFDAGSSGARGLDFDSIKVATSVNRTRAFLEMAEAATSIFAPFLQSSVSASSSWIPSDS